ncbi:unnamed protein product [Rhizophagus irregularis]|nr:unnamed protein product [Rhizophagus irregularis]
MYTPVSTNELGFVAYRIFGIYVNAASVKRLWSCMEFLQTNWRNRLMSSKALQMSKLRAEITYGQCLHNNLPSIEPTLDINNANKTDINQHFNNINGEYLQGWAEMLEEEKNVELDEETEEQSNTQIGDVTHPANDTSTKWDLLTLFNNIDVNLPFQ